MLKKFYYQERKEIYGSFQFDKNYKVVGIYLKQVIEFGNNIASNNRT